jgi:hypothetical protein
MVFLARACAACAIPRLIADNYEAIVSAGALKIPLYSVSEKMYN